MSIVDIETKYRNVAQRVTTMLWGLLIVGFGGVVIADLSGYNFDVELAGIIALALLGGWILASALVAMIPGKSLSKTK